MKFHDLNSIKYMPRYRKYMEFIGNIKNKRILDIGCSFGMFEQLTIKKGCREVIGIDINQKQLKNARSQVKDEKVKFIHASVLDLSIFKDKSFDIAVMWDVLEHIPKNTELKAFKEIYRVLKSQGSIYLSTPNLNFWSCVLDPAWWLIGHRHYSYKQLRRFSIESGLRIVSYEYRGGWYELFGMILFYIYKWVFNSQMPFQLFFDTKRQEEFFTKKHQFATVFAHLIKMK